MHRFTPAAFDTRRRSGPLNRASASAIAAKRYSSISSACRAIVFRRSSLNVP
jgi:hypothetical protein